MKQFDTDLIRSRQVPPPSKSLARRKKRNLQKLIQIPPYPVPREYRLQTPKLMVDMITLTIGVKSQRKRRTICEKIKDYTHDLVIKRYMKNYCKGSYHNTYQFTVTPKNGTSFTFKISHSPIDGHLEDGKRRFLRLELNPNAVCAKRMRILRKILCGLLGPIVVGRLYTKGVVTRLDLAMDFKGLRESLYLYKTTARTSSIYPGEHSATQYVGGARSRVRLRWYDKACETAARTGKCGESNWQRLDAEMRDLRCAPAELEGALTNPFERLRFYGAKFLDDQFSPKTKRLEEEFRRSVREHGLNATFQVDPRWLDGRQRYLKWLESKSYRRHLFDAPTVWEGLRPALAVLDGLWQEPKTGSVRSRRRWAWWVTRR